MRQLFFYAQLFLGLAALAGPSFAHDPTPLPQTPAALSTEKLRQQLLSHMYSLKDRVFSEFKARTDLPSLPVDGQIVCAVLFPNEATIAVPEPRLVKLDPAANEYDLRFITAEGIACFAENPSRVGFALKRFNHEGFEFYGPRAFDAHGELIEVDWRNPLQRPWPRCIPRQIGDVALGSTYNPFKKQYGKGRDDNDLGHTGGRNWLLPGSRILIGANNSVDDLFIRVNDQKPIKTILAHPTIECGLKLGMTIAEVEALVGQLVRVQFEHRLVERDQSYEFSVTIDDQFDKRVEANFDVYFSFRDGRLSSLSLHDGC